MPDSVPLAVLLIEDDADTCGNLQDIVDLDGYRVESAGSVAKAIGDRDWKSLFVFWIDSFPMAGPRICCHGYASWPMPL